MTVRDKIELIILSFTEEDLVYLGGRKKTGDVEGLAVLARIIAEAHSELGDSSVALKPFALAYLRGGASSLEEVARFLRAFGEMV